MISTSLENIFCIDRCISMSIMSRLYTFNVRNYHFILQWRLYVSTYKLLSLFKTCLKIWNVIFKFTRLSACPAVWFPPSCLQPLFRFFNTGDQASADHERNKWVTFNHGALQMHELDVKGKGFRIHLISIIQHGISLFNAFWYIMC